jgi:hypothetical protein
VRSPLESSIEGRAREHAEEIGGLLLKIHHGITGMPDRLLILSGMAHFIEFKRTAKDEPSKIQQFWHRELAKKAIHTFVLFTYADFVDLCRRLRPWAKDL